MRKLIEHEEHKEHEEEIIKPQRHRDTEEEEWHIESTNSYFSCEKKDLSFYVIGAAIEVHKQLGPGLLESTYEKCLAFELYERKINFKSQVSVPLIYKGNNIDCGYRLDFLIEDTLVVELKSIEKILPIHEVQLVTYLKLSNKKAGLLINFNIPCLRDGIRRKVN